MSKRYGRNQKRRARLEIDRLEREKRSLMKRLCEVEADYADLDRTIITWDKDIRDILGAYSALLIREPTIQGSQEPFEVHVHQPRKRLMSPPSDGNDGLLLGELIIDQVASLLKATISCEGDRANLAQVIRLRHEDRNGAANFFICRTISGHEVAAAIECRDIDYLAQTIAKELHECALHGLGRRPHG